jgi:hypothetical protein
MKLRSFLIASAFLASLTWAQSSSAAVLFSDNFDTTPQLLNQFTFSNWNVTAGAVDVIGTGGSFDYYPGNGNYVDLNGSNEQNGQLSSKTIFGAGTYTLTFSLGGSMGGANGVDLPNSKTTVVTLGDFTTSITLAPNAGFTSQTFTFTTTGGDLVFTSLAGGNPNVGNILDNVQVSAVPEASTWIMMLIGFAGMGLLTYRRSRKLSTALPIA